MMHSRSLLAHLWRRIVCYLMRVTFGYEHADVNAWRDSGHKMHAELLKLRARASESESAAQVKP